jgi:hypothetical protein
MQYKDGVKYIFQYNQERYIKTINRNHLQPTSVSFDIKNWIFSDFNHDGAINKNEIIITSAKISFSNEPDSTNFIFNNYTAKNGDTITTTIYFTDVTPIYGYFQKDNYYSSEYVHFMMKRPDTILPPSSLEDLSITYLYENDGNMDDTYNLYFVNKSGVPLSYTWVQPNGTPYPIADNVLNNASVSTQVIAQRGTTCKIKAWSSTLDQNGRNFDIVTPFPSK